MPESGTALGRFEAVVLDGRSVRGAKLGLGVVGIRYASVVAEQTSDAQ